MTIKQLIQRAQKMRQHEVLRHERDKTWQPMPMDWYLEYCLGHASEQEVLDLFRRCDLLEALSRIRFANGESVRHKLLEPLIFAQAVAALPKPTEE